MIEGHFCFTGFPRYKFIVIISCTSFVDLFSVVYLFSITFQKIMVKRYRIWPSKD